MSLLGNGLSGLTAAQQVLNTTSQNIANINTPGYSRQEAVLASRNDGSYGRANPGAGVEVTSLRRIADDYRMAALWRATSQSGFDNQMQILVEQVEGIVGGDELSITRGLDTFFAALNAAAEAPQSSANRQQILASADALANRFNQLANNLQLQERQVDEQAVAMTASVNSQAAGVAQLNSKIADIQARGGNTSQLEDQRDLAVQKLSEALDLRTQKSADGRMSVSLPNGQPLVMGNSAASLSLENGNLNLQFKNQSFPVGKAGGQLGALMSYKTDTLADLRTRLNAQASNLADTLNAQLGEGFDANGDPGVPLFTYDATGAAASIRVVPGMTADQLAFIDGDGAGNPIGGSGDNGNLLKIVALKSGFYDDYSGMIGDVAIQSAQIQAQASASHSLVEDARNRRDAVSGVNQDEEAIRLMNFTQAYQANAKVISTADQIFNTLMGMF